MLHAGRQLGDVHSNASRVRDGRAGAVNFPSKSKFMHREAV
jgi:hypothetical protein